VPTLPAKELGAQDDAEAAANEIGYPVLVKAAAGGGGRGMRVVENEADLDAAVEGARREAGASFGDDTVFLERWLTSSRHVEIQILGDNHGDLVHLFERECSIQRRHQKIIEEAPSSAVDAPLRAQMGEAAVKAARAIGYSSAGTVEFLLDGQDFWFLEVNTRLQVEHPVTEAITGLDLVREQIRLAEGEELGYGQDDLGIDGHAIEARLYAEDPANNFLPAPGVITAWHPAGNARFDSGVESGSAVSVEFDPMIAKVITHAPTRREAVAKLARALETTRLQGITHNRDFLVATLRTPEFLAGDTTTDFIERVDPPRSHAPSPSELVDAVIAAAMHAQHQRRMSAKVLADMPSGWRNSVMPPERVTYTSGDTEINLEYKSRRDGTFELSVGESNCRVQLFGAGDGEIDLAIDNRRIRASVTAAGNRWLVHGPSGDIELTELPRFPEAGLAEFTGGLYAPMPSRVISTEVAVGDKVAAGQLLMILEAMKMEHRITAPVDGTVADIKVSEGEQVDNGAMLVVLDTDEEQGE
jgi:propionyl-CoA carboxylase alpha chain